jgi:hypothetical protein
MNMRRIALLIAAFGATTLLQLYSAPAYAVGSSQTWVSHNGNDSNPCTEALPCLTFDGALANTAPGGEIDCLDSGDFSGSTQITFSVTIDCHGMVATHFNSNQGTGIDINAPGATVVLRGINFINLCGGCGHGQGVRIVAATTVHIEDCAISRWSSGGIADLRTTGLTQLFVKNTVVRDNHVNNNSVGILLAAAPKNSVVLENVQALSNGFGLAVATGNNVVISNSVFSGNQFAGIEVDAGGNVFVDNAKISHNASYGIFAQGTVTLANSDISFNNTSISGAATSFGNNRLFGNGGGTAPTPAGGVSTDFGQQ